MEGLPQSPEITVLSESAAEARARKYRFETAKATEWRETTRPRLSEQALLAELGRLYPRPSIVLRAAGVQEQLLQPVDRVRFYSLGAALLINGLLTALLAGFSLMVLLPGKPTVVVLVVGLLCGLLNFFVDRSVVNGVLLRRRDRYGLTTLALSLTGRVVLALLVAVTAAQVLTVQIFASILADRIPPYGEALRMTSQLTQSEPNPVALTFLLTGLLAMTQLIPTIMAMFARSSLYARVLRARSAADESEAEVLLQLAEAAWRPALHAPRQRKVRRSGEHGRHRPH